MARPTKYDKIDLKQVTKLAQKGFIDTEMCDFFNVCEKTWNNWKNKYPEFLQSLKEGKEISDNKVVRALYERALGYSHPSIHISNFQGMVTQTPIIKQYAPDPVSMIFWLKNRDPENWREKQEVEHSGGVTIIKDDIE